jgi:tetratricopeptide (TPR) repeat protein
MIITEKEVNQLVEKSIPELDQVRPGVFDDDVILTAIEKIEQLKNPDEEKIFALKRLIFRSPQLESEVEYGDVIYRLQEHEIKLNQGKNLMHWVLSGLVFFSKSEDSELMSHDYLDYGRALLYQGRTDLFIRILTQLVEKTSLSNFLVSVLIEDFTRLGYLSLARKLETRAQAHFGRLREDLLVDELIIKLENEKIDMEPLSPDLETQILDVLTTEKLDVDDELDTINRLYEYREMMNIVDPGVSSDDYLLFVPDLIQMVFDYWGGDNELSVKLLIILKALQMTLLPELSILGDLLNINQGKVFISEYFGKTQGYTFDHVCEMAMDSSLAPHIQTDAALMLADIADEDSEYKDQAIEALTSLISKPEVDDSRNEEMVSWLIAYLPDTKCYELKNVIVSAFNEDRVDPVIVKPSSFRNKWALEGIRPQKRTKGKKILLTCQSCQRTRAYGYDYILFDQDRNHLGHPWDSRILFINRSFQCIKCGAKENYMVADVALFDLFPVQISKTSPGNVRKETSEDVFFVSFNLTDILDYDEYQGGIRALMMAGMKDRIPPLKLAEYYRVIGWFDQARQYFSQAYQQDPNDKIAALLLACAEHDFGDRDKAKELYQKVMEMEKGGVLEMMDDPVVLNALRGLSQLSEGRNSPLPYPVNSNSVRLLDWIKRKEKQSKHHR